MVKATQKYNLSLRALSLLVAFTFALESLSIAAPEIKPTHAPLFQSPLPNLVLPKTVATLGDVYKGRTGKTLILVQDAHTNESGQLNISKALKDILRQEKIRFVFLEAADGNNSLAVVRDKAPLEKRKAVAREHLRKGTLDGSEYLDVTSDIDFIPWGVEDKLLYWQSLKAYEKVAKNRVKFQDYLKQVETTIETLKPRIYGPTMLAFDTQNEAFLEEKLSLTDYVMVLMKEAGAENLAITHYPHLNALMSVKEKEKSIDFEKANAEQEKAMALLSEEDRALLAGENSPVKVSANDHKTQKAFYALLESVIARNEATKQSNGQIFPELSKYIDYLKSAETLDARSILEERKAIEDALYESLAKTADEKEFHRAGEALRFLTSLFDLTVTPEEFRAYKKQKEAYDIAAITGFLNRKIMDLRNHYERTVFLEEGFEEEVRAAEEFYRLTYQRDMAFLDNALAMMEKTGENKAVLVAGGYHTPNLSGFLMDKGVSFIVVTPQILQETNRKKYESLLLSQNAKDLGIDPTTMNADKIAIFKNLPAQILALATFGITRDDITRYRKQSLSGRQDRALDDRNLVQQGARAVALPERLRRWSLSAIIQRLRGANIVNAPAPSRAEVQAPYRHDRFSPAVWQRLRGRDSVVDTLTESVNGLSFEQFGRALDDIANLADKEIRSRDPQPRMSSTRLYPRLRELSLNLYLVGSDSANKYGETYIGSIDFNKFHPHPFNDESFEKYIQRKFPRIDLSHATFDLGVRDISKGSSHSKKVTISGARVTRLQAIGVFGAAAAIFAAGVFGLNKLSDRVVADTRAYEIEAFKKDGQFIHYLEAPLAKGDVVVLQLKGDIATYRERTKRVSANIVDRVTREGTSEMQYPVIGADGVIRILATRDYVADSPVFADLTFIRAADHLDPATLSSLSIEVASVTIEKASIEKAPVSKPVPRRQILKGAFTTNAARLPSAIELIREAKGRIEDYRSDDPDMVQRRDIEKNLKAALRSLAKARKAHAGPAVPLYLDLADAVQSLERVLDDIDILDYHDVDIQIPIIEDILSPLMNRLASGMTPSQLKETLRILAGRDQFRFVKEALYAWMRTKGHSARSLARGIGSISDVSRLSEGDLVIGYYKPSKDTVIGFVEIDGVKMIKDPVSRIGFVLNDNKREARKSIVIRIGRSADLKTASRGARTAEMEDVAHSMRSVAVDLRADAAVEDLGVKLDDAVTAWDLDKALMAVSSVKRDLSTLDKSRYQSLVTDLGRIELVLSRSPQTTGARISSTVRSAAFHALLATPFIGTGIILYAWIASDQITRTSLFLWTAGTGIAAFLYNLLIFPFFVPADPVFGGMGVLSDLDTALTPTADEASVDWARISLRSLIRTDRQKMEALLADLKSDKPLFVPGRHSREELADKLQEMLLRSGARAGKTGDSVKEIGDRQNIQALSPSSSTLSANQNGARTLEDKRIEEITTRISAIDLTKRGLTREAGRSSTERRLSLQQRQEALSNERDGLEQELRSITGARATGGVLYREFPTRVEVPAPSGFNEAEAKAQAGLVFDAIRPILEELKKEEQKPKSSKADVSSLVLAVMRLQRLAFDRPTNTVTQSLVKEYLLDMIYFDKGTSFKAVIMGLEDLAAQLKGYSASKVKARFSQSITGDGLMLDLLRTIAVAHTDEILLKISDEELQRFVGRGVTVTRFMSANLDNVETLQFIMDKFDSNDLWIRPSRYSERDVIQKKKISRGLIVEIIGPDNHTRVGAGEALNEIRGARPTGLQLSEKLFRILSSASGMPKDDISFTDHLSRSFPGLRSIEAITQLKRRIAQDFGVTIPRDFALEDRTVGELFQLLDIMTKESDPLPASRFKDLLSVDDLIHLRPSIATSARLRPYAGKATDIDENSFRLKVGSYTSGVITFEDLRRWEASGKIAYFNHTTPGARTADSKFAKKNLLSLAAGRDNNDADFELMRELMDVVDAGGSGFTMHPSLEARWIQGQLENALQALTTRKPRYVHSDLMIAIRSFLPGRADEEAVAIAKAILAAQILEAQKAHQTSMAVLEEVMTFDEGDAPIEHADVPLSLVDAQRAKVVQEAAKTGLDKAIHAVKPQAFEGIRDRQKNFIARNASASPSAKGSARFFTTIGDKKVHSKIEVSKRDSIATYTHSVYERNEEFQDWVIYSTHAIQVAQEFDAALAAKQIVGAIKQVTLDSPNEIGDIIARTTGPQYSSKYGLVFGARADVGSIVVPVNTDIRGLVQMNMTLEVRRDRFKAPLVMLKSPNGDLLRNFNIRLPDGYAAQGAAQRLGGALRSDPKIWTLDSLEQTLSTFVFPKTVVRGSASEGSYQEYLEFLGDRIVPSSAKELVDWLNSKQKYFPRLKFTLAEFGKTQADIDKVVVISRDGGYVRRPEWQRELRIVQMVLNDELGPVSGARLNDSQEVALKEVKKVFGHSVERYARVALLYFSKKTDDGFVEVDSKYVAEKRDEGFPQKFLNALLGNANLIKLAKTANMEVLSLDGGTGDKLRRAAWKAWLVIKGLLSKDEVVLDDQGQPKLGAKGTDMGGFVNIGGKLRYLSVSEQKLLQIYRQAREEKFASLAFTPIVNGDSQPSYDALLSKENALGITAPGASKPMMYLDLLRSAGVKMNSFMFQADVPGIQKVGDSYVPGTTLKALHRSGGHGQIGIEMVANPEDMDAQSWGSAPNFVAFTNGDNQVSSDISAEIVGDMIENDYAIGNLVTPATRVDRKGGKYLVKLLRFMGLEKWIPGQRELAAAKEMGDKAALDFQAAGQKEGETIFGKGSAGQQPFNTNNFYINRTRLMPFLQDLKRAMGADRYLAEVVSPNFMLKKESIAKGDDGIEYYPVDSAIGNVFHSINEFVLKMNMIAPTIHSLQKKQGALTTDEEVLLVNYGQIIDVVEDHHMMDVIQYYNVPRNMFTPQKNPLDALLQLTAFRLDERFNLVEEKPGLEPAEFEIFDAEGKSQDSGKGYYSEFLNLLHTFVSGDTAETIMASPFDVSGLDSLEIRGNIAIQDTIFVGHVKIVNQNKTQDVFDLRAALLKDYAFRRQLGYVEGGPLVLKDVTIDIDAKGSLNVVRRTDGARATERVIKQESVIINGLPFYQTAIQDQGIRRIELWRNVALREKQDIRGVRPDAGFIYSKSLGDEESVQGIRGVFTHPEMRGSQMMRPLIEAFLKEFPTVDRTHPTMNNLALLEVLAREFDFVPSVSGTAPNVLYAQARNTFYMTHKDYARFIASASGEEITSFKIEPVGSLEDLSPLSREFMRPIYWGVPLVRKPNDQARIAESQRQSTGSRAPELLREAASPVTDSRARIVSGFDANAVTSPDAALAGLDKDALSQFLVNVGSRAASQDKRFSMKLTEGVFQAFKVAVVGSVLTLLFAGPVTDAQAYEIADFPAMQASVRQAPRSMENSVSEIMTEHSLAIQSAEALDMANATVPVLFNIHLDGLASIEDRGQFDQQLTTLIAGARISQAKNRLLSFAFVGLIALNAWQAATVTTLAAEAGFPTGEEAAIGHRGMVVEVVDSNYPNVTRGDNRFYAAVGFDAEGFNAITPFFIVTAKEAGVYQNAFNPDTNVLDRSAIQVSDVPDALVAAIQSHSTDPSQAVEKSDVLEARLHGNPGVLKRLAYKLPIIDKMLDRLAAVARTMRRTTGMAA